MRLISIIILLFLFCKFGHSQHAYIHYAQQNKYWFYRIFNNHEPAPQSENAYALWMKGDTTIHGKEYLNIYRSYLKGTHPCQFPPCFSPVIPYVFLDTFRIGFVREDTLLRTVNYLPEINFHEDCANTDYEVLNFNLNINDTISKCFRKLLGGEDKVWGPYGAIDTIMETFIFGKIRNVWASTVVSYQGMPHINQANFIEGVGMDFYDVINFGAEHLFIDFCEGDLFQCHILSSINHTDKTELQLYPNPSTGLFKVSGINLVVSARFTDIGGRSYALPVSDNEINISNFKSGIYFVEFTDVNNHQYFSKIVKL